MYEKALKICSDLPISFVMIVQNLFTVLELMIPGKQKPRQNFFIRKSTPFWG